VNKAE